MYKKKSLKNRILYFLYPQNKYKQLKLLFIKIFLISRSFSIQGNAV